MLGIYSVGKGRGIKGLQIFSGYKLIIIGLINRQCPKYKHTIFTIGGLVRYKLYYKAVGIDYLN